MESRVRKHAETLATHAVDLRSGDNVVISAGAVAEDLVVALEGVIGDCGATPVALSSDHEAHRAFLRAADEFETPDHLRALIEECDVFFQIRGSKNAASFSDVAPETMASYGKALQPVVEERLSKRYCTTQFPTSADAQQAEMSTAAYERFVWNAINKDWDAVREHQQQMVEILDPAEEVRIVSGDATDLTMSLAGNEAINDYGKKNLPGGEVFTAPRRESVEGEVLFDKPLYHQGREIVDARLVFEAGEVVEHEAAKNETLLTRILDTDDGSRYVGELGFGMNRDIDRFTYNILFDEKMGDTIHLALGRAYEDCVGERNQTNESTKHVDFIVDMSEDSFVEVDGEVLQRDGAFRFEDGFEG